MSVFKIDSWPPRIVFMGTPEFAAPIMAAIAEKICLPLLAVSQPDRPKGRGRNTLEPTPIKRLAQKLGVPVIQPSRIKTGEFLSSLRDLSPDVIVVAAYGRILTEAHLAVPRFGCVNVHASLLPAYRGAAPINWALINGETRTGVTVQRMTVALDAGEVLYVKETGIGPDETAGELYGRLSLLGAQAIVEFFKQARAGIEARPQDESKVSFAPVLEKSDGVIDWSAPAKAIHNRVRGVNPWPGGQAVLEGAMIKVHRTRMPANPIEVLPGTRPGTVLAVGRDSITVATGRGALDLLELQAEGGKRLPAADFARGKRLKPGVRFGREEPPEPTLPATGTDDGKAHPVGYPDERPSGTGHGPKAPSAR